MGTSVSVRRGLSMRRLAFVLACVLAGGAAGVAFGSSFSPLPPAGSPSTVKATRPTALPKRVRIQDEGGGVTLSIGAGGRIVEAARASDPEAAQPH
jgi:hypothetical protein